MMRPSGRKTLAGFLILLSQLRRQITSATRQFRSRINRSAEMKRLTTLPSVSTLLAYTIAAEIGQIERFPSGRHLSRYSLLAPLSDDSGEERDGPPTLRLRSGPGKLAKWAGARSSGRGSRPPATR
jgi:hypothetical protein